MKEPDAIILVESPQKARRLERVLQGRYLVLPTYGSVCDLRPKVSGGIAIDPECFLGMYSLTSEPRRAIDGKRVIAHLAARIEQDPTIPVLFAMENTQRGESIAAAVAHYLGLCRPRRVRCSSLDPVQLQSAIRDADDIDRAAVSAYLTRLHIDHVLTRTIVPWLHDTHGLHAAPCSLLGFIVDAMVNEREVALARRDGSAVPHTYEVEIGDWKANWVHQHQDAFTAMPVSNADTAKTAVQQYAVTPAITRRIERVGALRVINIINREVQIPAPAALNAAELIAVAARAMGWPDDKTRDVALQLYGGADACAWITDPESLVNTVPMAMETGIRAFLRASGLPGASSDACSSTPPWSVRGAQAILPVDWTIESAGTTDDQRALYSIIRDRAIFSQLAPATLRACEVEFTDLQGQDWFRATFFTWLDQGWVDTTAIHSEAVTAPDLPLIAHSLPKFLPGDVVRVTGRGVGASTPAFLGRFTDATLHEALWRLGVACDVGPHEFKRFLQGRTSLQIAQDGALKPTRLGQTTYKVVHPWLRASHIAYAVDIACQCEQIAVGHIDGPRLIGKVWEHLRQDLSTFQPYAK